MDRRAAFKGVFFCIAVGLLLAVWAQWQVSLRQDEIWPQPSDTYAASTACPSGFQAKGGYQVASSLDYNLFCQQLMYNVLTLPKDIVTELGTQEYIMRHANPPQQGLWLEFGVFRGKSVNFASKFRTRGKVYGFDTFTGLPEDWVREDGESWPKNAFSLDGHLPKVSPNVELIKGLFNDTLPLFLKQHPKEKVAYVNIDCDLYAGASQVLSMLGDRLFPGSIVFFDELVWIGENSNGFLTAAPYCHDEARALHEFLRRHPGVCLEFLPNRVPMRVSEPIAFRVKECQC